MLSARRALILVQILAVMVQITRVRANVLAVLLHVRIGRLSERHQGQVERGGGLRPF